MRVEEKASTDAVRQGRGRYVPRGVATTDLVVSRAWGARIWDAEGREYIDFAGGIACQNLGHGNAAGLRAAGPRAGRPFPPPVLQGRPLRAVRRRRGETRRALARQRRHEDAAREL